jgi:intein-encoded DNA endonuclease-like protein
MAKGRCDLINMVLPLAVILGNIPMRSSCDLFYLVGALRDGSIYKYNRNYTIVWYSNNLEYLKNEIGTRLKALGYAYHLDEYKKRQFRIRVYSKDLYRTIAELFEHPLNTKKRSPWPTPPIVKKAPLKCQIEYTKGFVDAEGSVIKSNKGVQVDVSQQIKEPLCFISKVFEKLGIRITGIYLGNDNIWRLRIASKASLINFLFLIGFRHPCKREKLLTLLKPLVDEHLPLAQHT